LKILAKPWPLRNKETPPTNNREERAFRHPKVGSRQERETTMGDLLSKFDSGELIGLAGMAGAFVCAVLGILLAFFVQWQKSRRAEMLAALKQDMLSRGMSADQIQTVLEAGSQKPQKVLGSRPSCKV
jgi:hypothetical protein